MVKAVEGIIKKLFFQNLPRKLFAVIIAMGIWIYINYSITETKVFPKMPIHIVNLPPERTVRGLMPNGLLEKRLTVQLTGRKDLIDRLDRKDFEIVIDASDKGDEWIVHLDKRNLVSTNPDIDLLHNITGVSHGEFIIKLSKLVTEKIPVYFRAPKGEPPEGYQFLDIFPQKLTHVVTGPEEDVKKLMDEGLEISFDLSLITQDELDALHKRDTQSDEVSFPVPDAWKRVSIPFLFGMKQQINGPESKYLRIDFLHKNLLPLDRDVPIWVFYTLTGSKSMNPITCPLQVNDWVIERYGLTIINRKLYASDISRLFLDTVRDRLEIVIIADEHSKGKPLRWELQLVDPQLLEDRYIAALMTSGKMSEESLTPLQAALSSSQNMHLAMHERYLRSRFREYMKKFKLYLGKDQPFTLNARQGPHGIIVTDR